jgi:serine protease Do
MRPWPTLLGLILLSSPLLAQDRDTKVRNDRKAFGASRDWIYNDLGEGVRAAQESNKPLLVVFRCIPCEACQEFDDDVARRDPIIRDLLDQFVCVRIVQANTIDLTHFQHDFDQSFAAYLMNPDLTIYGRFGTRSGRPEHEDISLEGLRKAMEAALRLHRDDGATKPSLAGKQVKQARYKTPRDYPSLSGKYGEAIDYEGQAAKSCMHCHQIREAERRVYRTANGPIPDEVLFPYPDPAVLGLKMDPKATATVERLTPGTPAERAGMRVGDEIVTLAGQPLLSIADLQWVLHNAPALTKLPAQIRRDGKAVDLTLDLPEGWRRGDISWRTTTWDLRRMGLGGLWLEELTGAQREEAKLTGDVLALRVKHLGEYGEHAVAKRAGFRKGDILVSFDGMSGKMSESELLAYTMQRKRPGDEVAVTVLRNGERATLKFAQQ